MQIFKETFIDKRLIRFILIIYVLAYIIEFSSVILIQLTNDEPSQANWDFWTILFKYILTFIVKLLFLFFAVYITTSLIEKKNILFKSIIIHSCLAFLMSFYTAALGLLINIYVFNEPYSIGLASIWIRGLNGLSFNFFVYVSILAIVYAYYYLQKQQEETVKKQQLKTQLLDSKINALQSQLQPHFLFNAMNDISALMDIDIEKSQNAIADLSELLRNTLQIQDSKYITLQKELDILQHYIDIEKIRFSDKLQVIIEIDANIHDRKVPPLILQPFIENAIKHGFSYTHDKLKIWLKISIIKQQLIFSLINDGSPLKEDYDIVFGNGINNVLERLDTLYDGNYNFEMQNTTQHNQSIVAISIAIPEVFEA